MLEILVLVCSGNGSGNGRGSSRGNCVLSSFFLTRGASIVLSGGRTALLVLAMTAMRLLRSLTPLPILNQQTY